MEHTRHTRQLRLAVLGAHRRTGEILQVAKSFPPTLFSDLIGHHHISRMHAELCIDLFERWDQVMAAERWGYAQGWMPPTAPRQALGLIGPWKRACLH